MRTSLIVALLAATALATPALAQDWQRGDLNARGQARQARGQARAQQAAPAAQAPQPQQAQVPAQARQPQVQRRDDRGRGDGLQRAAPQQARQFQPDGDRERGDGNLRRAPRQFQQQGQATRPYRPGAVRQGFGQDRRDGRPDFRGDEAQRDGRGIGQQQYRPARQDDRAGRRDVDDRRQDGRDFRQGYGGNDRSLNRDWRDDGRRQGFDRQGFDNRRVFDNRQGWNRDWRRNGRYDWNRYRNSNRNAFHLPRYYAPEGWRYGYRRFSVGLTLNSFLFEQNYWIDDPEYYRLPPAYGPYRWVRYYNDALLVDIRSGYVVDTIYDIFW